MLEKDKINLYRAIFYIIVVLSIPVVAYKDYQHWLNPLNLKPEENPKQHDGSQEFTPPRDFESVITPLPAKEGGATIYVTPEQLEKYSNEDDQVEISDISPEQAEEILAVPEIGIDN